VSSDFNAGSLTDEHDCLLLDLDGTVYRGSTAISGAVELLDRINCRTMFLTNNASRSRDEVAEHMRVMGFAVDPDDVITSAQAAARLLENELPCGSKVLVIGTDALAAALDEVGLKPVRSQRDAPVAVVQGHSPDTDWGQLAEGALAIRDGAMWVACNADATFPTERGLVPGNGSMVAALRTATGSEPLMVGKPAPHMVREALSRGCFESPLVVGDRLETDIGGATAARLPSMLALSGVSSASDLIYAADDCRPMFVAEDICALTQAADSLRISPQPGWDVEFSRSEVNVRSLDSEVSEGLSLVRAVAHAVWQIDREGCRPTLSAADLHAWRALRQWGLIDE
jgi:glycerol-1-phosphatase